MTGHHSRSKDASKTAVELPEVVIAQAEAAAASNQPEDIRHYPKPVSKATEEPRGSERSHASPSKNNHAPANASGTLGAPETPIEQVPQVAYGSQLGQVDFSQDGFDTKARVAGQVVLHPLTPEPRG